MNWYVQSMPTVKSLSSHITTACEEIKTLPGVLAVYLFGSYADHLNNPNYVVKDVDVIAATDFDSGDLMAIDNSRDSALRIPPKDLVDVGFNPDAVNFTRKFLSYQKYNIDHWACSRDGVLLHWGAIPDNREEWQELHYKAEKKAEAVTGVKRAELRTKEAETRQEWKLAHDQYIKKCLGSGNGGWFPSENNVEETLALAKLI
jgi:predicted nucleotidyltransferase